MNDVEPSRTIDELDRKTNHARHAFAECLCLLSSPKINKPRPGKTTQSRRPYQASPKKPTSGNPEPYPFKDVSWFHLWPTSFHAVDLGFPTPQVHILQTNKSRPFDKFVTQEKTGKDRNVDVRRDKGFRTEAAREEAVEAVEKGDGEAEADGKISQERLERRLVRQAGSCYAVVPESVVKPKIRDADTGPHDQGAHGRKVRDPEKDIG